MGERRRHDNSPHTVLNRRSTDQIAHEPRSISDTWLRGERDVRWFDPLGDRGELEQALALFLPHARTG